MGKFLKVQNLETFEEMLRNKDLKISKVIVETALKNLFNKKRFIHILKVELIEEEQIYDITLDRNNLLDTLKQNLEIHELHEDYLGCIEINKAIKQLEILV
jgi:hypothetical protein